MHAPCPVVVAHEDSVAVHREVVVGVGDPAEAADSLGFAFEEASMRGALLMAVHALARYPVPASFGDEDLKLAGWLPGAAGGAVRPASPPTRPPPRPNWPRPWPAGRTSTRRSG